MGGSFSGTAERTHVFFAQTGPTRRNGVGCAVYRVPLDHVSHGNPKLLEDMVRRVGRLWCATISSRFRFLDATLLFTGVILSINR